MGAYILWPVNIIMEIADTKLLKSINNTQIILCCRTFT